jgi:hypothetical protein
MEENEQLTLDNFRNELDEEVLERGWYYFGCGWVNPPREILPGFYEVRIDEVNAHAVSFTYEDDIFTDIFCTCEDRSHLVCRHMAAALCFFEAEREKQNKPVDWEQLENDDLKRRDSD